MMDEKTCGNCRWADKGDREAPCNGCLMAQSIFEQALHRNPFLWEPKTVADAVNHPGHYATGKFECIDVMVEAIGLEDTKGFCLCNAFKYIYRCTKKHADTTVDVKKAVWYLNKFLELEEGRNPNERTENNCGTGEADSD